MHLASTGDCPRCTWHRPRTARLVSCARVVLSCPGYKYYTAAKPISREYRPKRPICYTIRTCPLYQDSCSRIARDALGMDRGLPGMHYAPSRTARDALGIDRGLPAMHYAPSRAARDALCAERDSPRCTWHRPRTAGLVSSACVVLSCPGYKYYTATKPISREYRPKRPSCYTIRTCPL